MGTSLWHYALWTDRQAYRLRGTHTNSQQLCTPSHTHIHTHSKTHTHNYLKSFQQHDNCNLHTRRTKCINTSTTENNIVGEIIKKVMCSHKQKQYSLSENRHWWEEVRVWQRDRGRHTVRWVRSNPRMETKNTSVHVRHVKEDTSWHLMPGKKITLLLYASKYWHLSILLIRKFSSQTLSAILLNTKH